MAQYEIQMGVRRFGRVNWLGLYTLMLREIRRFLAVWTQTLLAPLVTAGLFLTIFTLAIGPSRGDVMGVPFVHFLAPGILTMTVIQNAFANTSSSIMISKVQGNIVDTLMPPLSPSELVIGYLSGGVARGMVVGLRDLDRDGDLCRSASASPAVCDCLYPSGRAVHRGLGRSGGHCKPEIRPYGRDHQFHHHAAVVSVGHLLLRRNPAAVV